MVLSKEKVKTKHIVGWSEYVDFPDWSIKGLQAKIDTGARTSSLHVENIEEIGYNRIRFEVILHRKKRDRHIKVTARVLRQAKVRSSSGEYTKRYFIRTLITIGPVTKEIELSLVSREKMLFRMLIGRKALEKDFLVDVSKRAALTQKSKKKKVKL